MSDEKKPPASAVAPDPRLKIDREPLLDSHQAAAILKVHPRTLQRLRASRRDRRRACREAVAFPGICACRVDRPGACKLMPEA
jgi:hypothetical protein